MDLTRTTLRINSKLKQAAEKQAIEQNMTLQAIFNQALEDYLQNIAKKRAHTIVFQTHDLGEDTDNLTRGDFYPNV